MIPSVTTITILVDNHAGDGLVPVHGFALWITFGNRHILFDTGPGEELLINAQALGIDLAVTDTIALSHGHYDHSGGLEHALRLARSANVYCHPGAVQPRYAVRNGLPKPLRMGREDMAALDRVNEERVHWVQQPVWLSDDIGLTGPIPRRAPFEDPGGPFFLDPAGHRPDPIDDDQALWIHTRQGIVVCVGCAHAGLINTLDYVRFLNQGQSIRAVIGGFHLVGASDERLAQTLTALHRFDPALIVPCHCTGEKAVRALQQAFGDRVHPGWAGMRCLDFLVGSQEKRGTITG
jgi:7,8-dihydropterin-6-yl-methyl-4-(beta-D-ribofuranosyl)aminobenzene 5'-phosphate synthase